MVQLRIRIIAADYRPIAGSTVTVTEGEQRHDLRVDAEGNALHFRADHHRVTIKASAPGYLADELIVNPRAGKVDILFGLRKPGQLAYRVGDHRLVFAPIEDELLVHLRGQRAAEHFARLAGERNFNWRNANEHAVDRRDSALVRLSGPVESIVGLAEVLRKASLEVDFARIIAHPDRLPIGLTHELVVRFREGLAEAEAAELAARHGMRIIRHVRHAGNAFLLRQDGLPSYRVLAIADALAADDATIYVEPNLLLTGTADAFVPNDPLWPNVPHLRVIKADEAWSALRAVSPSMTGGSPEITIAILDDDGVTPNHPELTANLTDGTSKLIANFNFVAVPPKVQTVADLFSDHGTQCAGSATAAFEDSRGLPGVAPNCHLIGAYFGRTVSPLLLADIYMWAAGFDNGAASFPALPARAADVVCMSWGLNGIPLDNVLRDSFDFITTYGRGGRGCVLCFSIGNNGYTDFTDPTSAYHRSWPTYERTLAVGASISANPTTPVLNSRHLDPFANPVSGVVVAEDKRSLYSPIGNEALRKPDLVSTSDTAWTTTESIDPVFSAVRVGVGDVKGSPTATTNDYQSDGFGGTSHAAPCVAGAVALMLSARPELSWVEVRNLLRRTCARIDPTPTMPAGAWVDLDGDGVIDFSPWYGSGRLDVDAAVKAAINPATPLADIIVRDNIGDVGNVPSAGDWAASPDIWVRQDATEAIPALGWNIEPAHQNPRRGQDNAVFCRVKNRGAVVADVVYVRAMVAHWPGMEFTYPIDFEARSGSGAAPVAATTPGSYLIGELRIDNLAAGADHIVKFNWPAANIPPATVMVGGMAVQWHPCLLLEASPHDGPATVGGLTVPVRGDNNLAQRNIYILNAGEAEAMSFIAVVAGTWHPSGVDAIIVDARRLRGKDDILISAAESSMLAELRASDSLAPASTHGTHREALAIRNGQRVTTIPLRLGAGRFEMLLVAIGSDRLGDLHVTHRRGDGELGAGYVIRRDD